MLIVVTPENQQHYWELLMEMCTTNSLDNPFANSFCAAAKDSFGSVVDAVYLIYVDERYGVQGFARLLPTTGRHLCAEKCTEPTPTGENIWELSSIQIMIPENSVLLECEVAFATISTLFFHELFETLCNFCDDKKIDQLLLVGEEDCLDRLQQIGWPLEGNSLQLYMDNYTDLPSGTGQNRLFVTSILMSDESYRQFELDRKQFVDQLHMEMKSSFPSFMIH